MESRITIYNLNGRWLIDATGAFGGGFCRCALSSSGHAASLISRYASNPEGCTIWVDPDYPDADKLTSMAT